ncbi:glycosyltransferase family 2 protein [bacterium]|nr:MAG: glycosyltransferase family 2 protein [bacterium]
MKPQPRVAVIVVNWNGRDITLECLHSLSALTYPRADLIVVDNGSSDGSVEAIRARYPDVTLLTMPENLRFAGGNNAGMREALARGADMVLLLNNDTVVDAEFLTRLVARMEANPSYGMVAPKIFYFGQPDRLWFAGGTISMWAGTMRHIGIREVDCGQYDTVREIGYASGCCILVRAEVIRKIGMLDESYHMYTEDADWSMRARRGGYALVFEPAARVWHKLSVSAGGHLSWYKLKNKFISNFRFFWRYAAWYQRLIFPWLSVIVHIIAAGRYLVTARWKLRAR